jgi:hypothetical protein
MTITVFLSYPKPSFVRQQSFITRVAEYLSQRGLSPRTLGITDYDMDAPLTSIRRLISESNGLVTIAFRRTLIEQGRSYADTDIANLKETPIVDKWLTTPWAHIEPAMAYQIGLPVLIFRESGVLTDGILDRGVIGLYVPEFDLENNIDEYFQSAEWNGIIGKWEGYVRATVERKGKPPVLF